MKVKIKKLSPDAVLPKYMRENDAGMDLVATSKVFDEHGNCVFGTSLAIEIPVGYMGLIFPRSSNSNKDLLLANSVGVIDPGYRGEIILKFKPSGFFASVPEDDKPGFVSEYFDYICFGKEDIDGDDITELYSVGDRIGQLIIMPRLTIEWEEVHELSISERGVQGFGSTDRANHTAGDYQGSHVL